jgi:hypothetical protein
MDIEPLDKRISVRLTAAEKIKLTEDAQIAGLGLSELVRRRYFGRPIIANADAQIAGLGLSELVRRRYFGRPIIANADAAVLRELRRLGGLLKYLNSESSGTYNQQVQETLSTLKDYMEVLCDRQESSK